MRNSYTIYKPSKLIRDISNRSEAYYQSKDIHLSPFTKIGSLLDTADEGGSSSSIEIQNRQPLKHVEPLFSDSVTFGVREGVTTQTSDLKKVKTPIISERFKSTIRSRRAGIGRTLLVIPSIITILLLGTMDFLKWSFRHVFLNAAHIHFVPKKYTAAKGLRPDLSGSIFTFAKVVLPGIAVLSSVLLLVIFQSSSHEVVHHQIRANKPQTITSSSASVHQKQSNTSMSNTGPHTSSMGLNSFNISSLGTSSQGATTTPTSGGYGGSVPTQPTTSVPEIPGVTVPYPITLPAQSVQSGGKQVVGSSPITITLN